MVCDCNYDDTTWLGQVNQIKRKAPKDHTACTFHVRTFHCSKKLLSCGTEEKDLGQLTLGRSPTGFPQDFLGWNRR